MRATGIVRRIDELGRVVIPKEIRRTLRIREGDPLEIFTDHDGEVVLKKYSPIGEIAAIAKDYTDSLHRTLGHIACICDRDMVVSASGAPKKELWEKALSPEIDQVVQSRQTLMLNLADGAKMLPITVGDSPEGYTAQILTPILVDGEVIGALMLLSRENGVAMTDIDMKVAETTATIVGRQMEQ
jgi:AbrB family transcriptional regulator (stage V sporulation protein T)